MADFNTAIIDEFRSNGGTVTTNGFGRTLVLLHCVGAKSGTERVNPLFSLPVDDGWLIAGSAAGGPKHPDWYFNVLADPEVSLEVPGADGGIELVQATATDLTGADRDAAWARFEASSDGFKSYVGKAAPRVIPVVKLVRH